MVVVGDLDQGGVVDAAGGELVGGAAAGVDDGDVQRVGGGGEKEGDVAARAGPHAGGQHGQHPVAVVPWGELGEDPLGVLGGSEAAKGALVDGVAGVLLGQGVADRVVHALVGWVGGVIDDLLGQPGDLLA